MSSQAVAAPAERSQTSLPWAMWRRQVGVILRAELRRNFVTKRGIWIYLLALLPVGIILMHSLVALANPQGRNHRIASDVEAMSVIFQIMYLRLLLFFGSVGIFTYLFRGEVLERSLHYYFLAPVRREVLVFAKYLAGLITSGFFFMASVALSFTCMFLHYAPIDVQQFLLENGGLQQAVSYLIVTALACIGYGSIFLWLGMRAKNPMIPAALIFGWEAMNLFLPGWLKKISVIYYLKQLLPVGVSFGRRPNPLSIISAVTESTPPWIAVTGLLVFSAAVLWLAMRTARKLEISYSSD